MLQTAKLATKRRTEMNDFGLEDFKSSPMGRRIASVFEDRDTVSSMIALTRYGIPPVQEVGRRLLELDVRLEDMDKRFVGRWTREIMEENGWTTDGLSKKRVADGCQFSTGAVYYQKGESSRKF